MRIKYLLIIIIIHLAHNSYCQIYGIAREAFAEKSNCPINSISVYKSIQSQKNAKKTIPKLVKSKMYFSSKETYNLDDQIKSDIFFKKNGLESRSTIYEYDDKARLIGIDRKYENNSIYIKRQYLNNQIFLHTIDDGEVKRISIQSLDQNGRIFDWIFLGSKRDTLYRYQYQYDDFGNEIIFNKSGIDNEDNYIIKKYFDSTGQIKKYEKYDCYNKLIEEIEYKEIKNTQYKDSEYRIVHQKASHKVFGEKDVETFQTEIIYFVDKCNNTVKIYSNQNCGTKGNWNITYMDYDYY